MPECLLDLLLGLFVVFEEKYKLLVCVILPSLEIRFLLTERAIVYFFLIIDQLCHQVLSLHIALLAFIVSIK